MAEICCGVVSEGEPSVTCEPKSARRRRMEIRRFKVLADVTAPEASCFKRQKTEGSASPPGSPSASPSVSPPREVEIVFTTPSDRDERIRAEGGADAAAEPAEGKPDLNSPPVDPSPSGRSPRYGVTSVCGRRRDMEDAVSIRPWFCREDGRIPALHFFGVFDGHGCSHVIELAPFYFFSHENKEIELHNSWFKNPPKLLLNGAVILFGFVPSYLLTAVPQTSFSINDHLGKYLYIFGYYSVFPSIAGKYRTRRTAFLNIIENRNRLSCFFKEYNRFIIFTRLY